MGSTRGLLALGLGMMAFGVGGACRTTPVTSPGPTAGVDPELSATVHAVIDEAADPCTDFYRYACGQWLDETTLPGDQTRFGRFHELRQANLLALQELLDAAAAAPAEGEAGQLGRFYGACLDEAGVDAAGTAALAPLLEEIKGSKKSAAMMKTLAHLHQVGARALFSVSVDADYDDPTVKISEIGQGGLALPDRQYYLEEGEAGEAMRAAYVAHVAGALAAIGEPDAEAMAVKVVALETELAKATIPRAEIRNPDLRRNKRDLAALSKHAPKLPWEAYFEAAGRPDLDTFNVVSPSFIEAVNTTFSSAKWPVRRAYLSWHLVNALAPHMPKTFADAHYDFFDKTLRGQAEPTPRWRHCVQSTDGALGEKLGQEYVAKHFGGDSREIAVDMIARIEGAFESALPSLEWMDDPTRERAVEKMTAIVNKIGHPDQWRDYAELEVGEDHLANVIAARRFEFARVAKTIGQPVDETEWHMTPPTVNAYYNPSGNEMVFPAGILQPPFFSADRPMAMNFGGIGMVMGHELTHGFDDNGRKFDGDGRLTEWWGADAVSRFEERATCVENLYSSYEVQPGVNLNGALTLGENIADLGGIRQAHGAYTAWAEQNGGDTTPFVEGLTNEQLLFVSFGQIWCSHATPETERVLATTDSHSHPRYRVNGPLSQFPEFWEAFSCGEGTPMHPTNVCEVW